MCQKDNAVIKIWRAGAAMFVLLGMLFPFPVAALDSVQTADDLLEVERQIEINKRMLELRDLQIKRQEQDMRFFQGGMGNADGPSVVRVPPMRLEMIRSYHGELIAGLRYGSQYMDLRKGDQVDQGIKVVEINALGLLLNVHGSQMRLGLNREVDHKESSGDSGK